MELFQRNWKWRKYAFRILYCFFNSLPAIIFLWLVICRLHSCIHLYIKCIVGFFSQYLYCGCMPQSLSYCCSQNVFKILVPSVILWIFWEFRVFVLVHCCKMKKLLIFVSLGLHFGISRNATYFLKQRLLWLETQQADMLFHSTY